MSKKQKRGFIIAVCVILALLLVGIFLTGSGEKEETIREVMKDAVLHEDNKVSFLGLKDVNPAYISSCVVVGALLLIAALIRIFAIPRFKYVPGKFQLLIEELVGMFDGMAKSNSPHRNQFLGGYIFAAGAYIFVGTIFELFGL